MEKMNVFFLSADRPFNQQLRLVVVKWCGADVIGTRRASWYQLSIVSKPSPASVLLLTWIRRRVTELIQMFCHSLMEHCGDVMEPDFLENNC